MGLMSQFNKGGVRFDVDIESFTFISLKDLYKKSPKGEKFVVDGLYINKKSSFGDHPVAILAKEELLVDLPAHLTEDVKAILKNEEVVEAIKKQKVGFSIEEYTQDRYKKTCYGIKWEDRA